MVPPSHFPRTDTSKAGNATVRPGLYMDVLCPSNTCWCAMHAVLLNLPSQCQLFSGIVTMQIIIFIIDCSAKYFSQLIAIKYQKIVKTITITVMPIQGKNLQMSCFV